MNAVNDYGVSGSFVAQMHLNPLDEPSPLGLRLRKTTSLLDLIQMRLSEGNASSKTVVHVKKDCKTTAATDKLKASNFPASLLKIVMDTSASEEIITGDNKELKGLVPGLHSSMSMSDLVNHIENRITKNRTPGDQHPLSHEEQQSLHILEDISRCLFNDSLYMSSTSDEKSIMSRVNSLCCLLQDPTTVHDLKAEHETNNGYEKLAAERSSDEPNLFTEPASGSMVLKESSEEVDDHKTTRGIPRIDSVGELLLNLPRIASLPQFFNI
ncbi:hypothetical protein E3N88_39579 [Mikania micrantha]|uniref:Uncharacterized protein n=1 Tax=Mikania micrantha TaxID=192012 RepID=A0A5N6LZU9_9ASTR|nr:hypothetical protein E3N88_39579 [Mikania micrantha]